VTRRRLGPGAVALLCGLAAIVLFVGTLMAYGRRELFDTGRFTERSLEVVHEDVVRELLADTLTRQALESGSPDLVALRPLSEATISRLIDSGAVDPALSFAISEAHRSAFTPGGSPLVLSLRDVVVVARGVVAAVSPGAELPTSGAATQVTVTDRDGTRALRIAEQVRWLGVALPILAMLLLAIAVALARDRRRAATACGLALVSAGLLVALTVAIVKPLVLAGTEGDSRAVAEAVWGGLVGDLGWWGVALLVAGAVLVAAATSVIPAGDVGGAVRRVRGVLLATPPGGLGVAVRVGRAVVAITLGVLAIADPAAGLRLVMLGVGTVTIAWGASEILRLTAPAESAGAATEALRRRAGGSAAALTAGLAIVATLGLGVVALATGGGEAPPPGPRPCNDHPELCDRRLDEVAMVTTHNSMSVAKDPGWFNAHHYNTLEDPLDGGARGLLIDTHLGRQTNRAGFGGTKLVETDLSGTSREALVEEIGVEAVVAAERLSGRILYGEEVDDSRLFLCHGLCEIGATDVVEEYRRIRRWLVDHPDQVVVMVIQDAAPIETDVAAIEAAGLDDLAWPERLTPATPMPTLRQMIDAGKTILISHESEATGGPDWYQPTYSITQETPYLFSTVAEISSAASCAPNRGTPDAPLFLLNHWLDKQPVQPSQSEQVNPSDVLLARARLCQSERGKLPNLVAVNFVEIGDTAAVVDALNGVETAPAP
jgi:hypothetical protein